MSGGPVVVGVDGCRGGWLMVMTGLAVDDPIEARLASSFGEVHHHCLDQGVTAVGIDMPIGLPDDGAREADAEARAILGHRRSTLFPTPAHAVIDAPDYETALRLSRETTGKGLSKQAYSLLPKIREVRRVLRPDDQPRFSEVHPETSFTVMAGRPLASKAGLIGHLERIELVGRLVGSLPDGVGELHDDGEATVGSIDAKFDDLLDACAAAWTARRMAAGEARVLGHGFDPDGFALTLTV